MVWTGTYHEFAVAMFKTTLNFSCYVGMKMFWIEN